MLQIPHANNFENLIEQEIINPQQKKQKKAFSSNSSRTTTASYTHQNQLDVRHSSFDEDIDLDSGMRGTMMKIILMNFMKLIIMMILMQLLLMKV